MSNIEPRPFKLKWERQGKVAWRADWVSTYGPTRHHIPGLDEHIGFANFDLETNSLPTIAKGSDGQPYVIAIPPLTEVEMSEIRREMIGYFGHPKRASDVFTDKVIRPLVELATVLNFVAYHGFVPAEDSPGLRHLRALLPPKEYEVRFPDGPQAGI